MIVKNAIKYGHDIVSTGENYGEILSSLLGKFHLVEGVALRKGEDVRYIFGFVTDKGEFLDREQALTHFISSGQILKVRPEVPRSILLTEDVYN